MHYKYFGLSKNPFDVDPDPDFLYLSPQHKEALSHLLYSIISKKSFLLLTGDIGVGKTTILNYFLRNIYKRKDVNVLPIYNPNLSIRDFYQLLADHLFIKYDSFKSRFLLQFSSKLSDFSSQNKSLVIIIDEAQAASEELLEELRLLSNVASGLKSLIIILVGQPELLQKLSVPKLSSLRQRFSYRYHLGPFKDEFEVSEYIITRILRAGSPKTRIFTNDAIAEIYRLSRGIPRIINILADHAMLNAYLRKGNTVNLEDVKSALEEVKHTLPEQALLNSLSRENAKYFKINWIFIVLLIFFLILSIIVGIGLEKEAIDFWRGFWVK